MKDYSRLIDRKKIPSHIAIIMDGNGRWAKKKSLPRSEGHRRGSEIIEPLMDAALDMGIRAVSLYAFSTENWVRPKPEIIGLWKLLDYFFNEKIVSIKAKGIRVRHSGFLDRLPASSQRTIRNAIDTTRENKKLTLNFCLNYGGRQDIVQAVNGWIDGRGRNERVSARDIEKRLLTAGLPEVDLLIRTGGECRISNFLIWQIAYSELVFMDVLWPDFRPNHLYKAVYEFQLRERRFGGI
ncbi:MAG: di-trans,poly-cis-decaprenylcistransferase [Spirochaetes bacterium]|nr:di-trans,poly-cis-decaprenylcistransferase [Spirochaetota bacterium]